MRALTFIFAFLLATSLGCKKDDTSQGAAAPVGVKPGPAPAKVEASAQAATTGGGRVVPMEVTVDGFVPANVTVKANEPVTLRVTRKTDETCATELLIDGTDIDVKLPLHTPVDVTFTPKTAGRVKFGCAMDKMVGGLLLVE